MNRQIPAFGGLNPKGGLSLREPDLTNWESAMKAEYSGEFDRGYTWYENTRKVDLTETLARLAGKSLDIFIGESAFQMDEGAKLMNGYASILTKTKAN